jgi:hypothetical protein
VNVDGRRARRHGRASGISSDVHAACQRRGGDVSYVLAGGPNGAIPWGTGRRWGRVNMRKSFVALVACAAVAFTAIATPVAADSGTLPGGTSISVEIGSPAAGDVVEAGPITVTGTASVGAAPAVKNTTVVYTLDISGSTGVNAGVDCDGVAGNDTVLACEKAAVARVNTEAATANSPVLNSGVAVFSDVGTALDVEPAPGTQLLTAPGPNITNAIAPLVPTGGTSFAAGVGASNTILNAPGAATTRTLVFLSDGLDTAGGSLPPLPAGTVVRAFAIGSANCDSGVGSLNSVAALGAPGSSCTNITNLAVLDDVISDQIGSSLDALTISLDGATPVPIGNANIDPDLPQSGPASVTFSTSVTLASGTHQICVTATGTDVGGAGSVSDCVDVEVMTTVVQCGTGVCEATATDRDVATARFTAINLPKEVGLRAGDRPPGACGGANCVTAFDVLFDGTATNGRASLFVTTARGKSTPFWKGEIYMDGVKVTRSCIWNVITRTEKLPCKIIGPTLSGGTFYYVKFAADPRIKFR